MAEHFETEMGRPREFLVPCLLLLLAESPGHGYELMERLKPLGFDWGGFGPIYRELRWLEEAGLTRSDWVVGERGPGRRVYEITLSGREFLDESVAGVTGLQRLIASYLARFGMLAGTHSPASTGAAPSPPGKPRGSTRTRAFRGVMASGSGGHS